MIKNTLFTIFFIAIQAINTPATAQNKCSINGQINYQDIECPKGTDQTPKPQAKTPVQLNLSDAAQRKAITEKWEKDFDVQLKIARSQPRVNQYTGSAAATNTEPNEQTIPMPFNQCVASVNRTLQSLSVQRRNASHIIDSGNLTITKVCAVDGTVLIGCNKADATMMISRITSKC